MADISKIKLPDNVIYDIVDNQPVVKNIPNTPCNIATFSGAAALPMPSLKVGIEPQQDFHGYDHPWAGGAGKNKINITLTYIKSINKEGTWNGNTYTFNGLTYEFEANQDDCLTKITVNGTASTGIMLRIYRGLTYYSNGTYIVSGLTGGSDDTYQLEFVAKNYSRTIVASGENTLVANNILLVELATREGVTVSNLVVQPMVRLSTEDSTFAPYSNKCSISGWNAVNVYDTGKNLFDKNTVTFAEGFITSTGEVSTTIPSYEHTSYIKVKPSTNYVFSGDIIGANLVNAVAFYDSKMEFISRFAPPANTPASFTTPNNCTYIITNVYNIKDVDTIQLEEGTTATTYEPFGTTYTTTLKDGQGNPMTCYGGTLDVVSGVLTVDRARVIYDGSNDEGITAYNTSLGVYYLDAISDMEVYIDTSLPPNVVTNYLKPVSQSSSWGVPNIISQDKGLQRIVIGSPNFGNSVENCRAYLSTNNLQLLYKLATPITVQLTPTQVNSLLGTNNIWADTGKIEEGSYVISKYSGMTATVANYASSATTASKLGSTDVGSATQPIYLNGGSATACTYTLEKSVPSDAVFTDHYAWTDITGKPSTFTPSTHYHYELKTIGDQRTISTTPNDYVDKLIFRGLKNASAIGSPGGGSDYSYLVGLRGWGDSSGGDAHELAFNNNGIYCRHGATTTWGNWSKIFTSADTYTGTLTSSQVTTALGFTPPSSDTNTHRPIKLKGTQILGNNTTALDFAEGSNITLSNSSGTITIAATDTTYESKTAASGGTDLSLVTTGEKYTWNNKLNKSGGTMTGSLTLSSGDITVSAGSVVAGDASAQTAKWCRAYNSNGWVGVQVNSLNDAAPVLGVNSKGGLSTSEAHYMLFRDISETSATVYTSGTYIGGYNYNNEWESFLVQGRTGHYWGVVPAIQSNNGVMEVGAILDFHTSSTGTNDYNYRLRCTGEGAMTYSGTWTKASSIKIKENIEDMDLDEAKKIFDLRPVSFDYKEGFGQKDQRGLIAEEVTEVLPKLVIAESGQEGEEDWAPASVDYIGVVPYLIKIVQEQQKEIDELKAKVG